MEEDEEYDLEDEMLTIESSKFNVNQNQMNKETKKKILGIIDLLENLGINENKIINSLGILLDTEMKLIFEYLNIEPEYYNHMALTKRGKSKIISLLLDQTKNKILIKKFTLQNLDENLNLQIRIFNSYLFDMNITKDDLDKSINLFQKIKIGFGDEIIDKTIITKYNFDSFNDFMNQIFDNRMWSFLFIYFFFGSGSLLREEQISIFLLILLIRDYKYKLSKDNLPKLTSLKNLNHDINDWISDITNLPALIKHFNLINPEIIESLKNKSKEQILYFLKPQKK